MADGNTPYRRLGTNSWKELLDQVNDKLANPPTASCDDIDPIEEPDECHRWSIVDINEVMDVMEETCGDIAMTRAVPGDLWEVSFIDEIEDNLDLMWCDCEEECFYPCDNAQAETVYTSLGSLSSVGCLPFVSHTCIPTWQALRATEIQAWFDAKTKVTDNDYDMCISKAELARLEAVRDAAVDARDTICALGPSPACSAATTAASDAQTDYEAELAIFEPLEMIVDEGLAEMLSTGPATLQLPSINYEQSTPCENPGSGPAWTNMECEDNGTECHGFNLTRCRTSWTYQRRQILEQRATFLGVIYFTDSEIKPWLSLAGGFFNPDGTPVLTFSNRQCCGTPVNACVSGDCSVIGCPNTRWDYEVRMCQAGPSEFTPFNCDGDPCEEPTPP
jgi:hypothetical protein